MFAELQACVAESWSPKIGDPHFMGWVTVAAYALAAILSFRLFLRARGLYDYRTLNAQRVFWFGVALLFAFLSVNKQLDLQSLFTAIGRCHAQQHGWYAERRGFQNLFIVSLLLGSGVGFFFLAIFFRRILLSNWLAFVGVFLVVSFVLVRAVGFHDFDAFIDMEISSFRMNWILELGGIACVLVSILSVRSRPPGAKEAVYIHYD